MAFRIRNWTNIFENAESRKLKALKWVAMPNKMNTQGYTALMDHPNGAAHLGAWCAIVEICSAREPRELRGTLPESDGSIGGISRVLGRISRIPPVVFEELIPRLIQDPEIQWIELDPATSGELTDVPGKSPDVPGAPPEVPGTNRRGLKGTEGEGKEEKDTPTAPFLISWRTDESYVPFVGVWREIATVTGKPLIDDDFADAHFRWKFLDPDQKVLAVSTSRDHLSKGVWAGNTDPQFIPLPKNYLVSEYKRPVPVPKARDSPAVIRPSIYRRTEASEMGWDGVVDGQG